MITKLRIFEKLDLSDINININISDDNKNYLMDNLSMIIQKRNKSSLRIKSIDGYFDKSEISHKTTYINILMTNKDVIEGEYSSKNKNIKIHINEKLVYNVDNKDFNNKKLLEKVVSEYKKYLKNQGLVLKENIDFDDFEWEDEEEEEDDMDNVVKDYKGNYIKKSEAVWCDFDHRWCHKDEAIWIEFLGYYTTPDDDKYCNCIIPNPDLNRLECLKCNKPIRQ